MSHKARYFPVLARPLKMAAGLSRFGTDFGQGALDQQYFQVDPERARYLEAKRHAPRHRHVVAPDSPSSVAARAAALTWMRSTLAFEAPAVLDEVGRDREARDPFDAFARALQEDFCVLCAGDDGEGAAALIDVRFPSGWRPERLAGASFDEIHRPVPGFPNDPQAARSMVRAMIERGPFVRFVWTLTPNDTLDQHPEARGRIRWDAASEVWLRVERQITVPLTAASASLFLIRVYHYAFDELSAEQRATARTALAVMPEMIRRYKGLPTVALFDAVLARGKAAGSERVGGLA
jgi:hypothetical protein